jgi:hypothetical protein
VWCLLVCRSRQPRVITRSRSKHDIRCRRRGLPAAVGSRHLDAAIFERGMVRVSVLAVTRAGGGMADALASGASVLRDVGVQVPLRPPHWPQLIRSLRPVVFPAFFLELSYRRVILGRCRRGCPRPGPEDVSYPEIRRWKPVIGLPYLRWHPGTDLSFVVGSASPRPDPPRPIFYHAPTCSCRGKRRRSTGAASTARTHRRPFVQPVTPHRRRRVSRLDLSEG